MSELFMECEEEELEPWQRRIPEINLVDDDDDDDDEPIFVGEIRASKVTPNTRPSPAPVAKAPTQWRKPPAPVQNTLPVSPVQRGGSGTVAPVQRHSQPPASTQPVSSGPAQLTVRAAPQPVAKSLLIPVTSQPGSSPAAAQNVSRTLTTVSPQPIIITNNQGYILTSPQIPNNSTFITPFGTQYPSGTSFAVLPAGQQLLQPVAPAGPVPGVIHRPQVQLIQNNVVTLTSMQSPPQAKQPPAQPSTQFTTSTLQAIHTNSATLQPIQLGCSASQAKPGTSANQKSSPLPAPHAGSHSAPSAGNGSSTVKRTFQPNSMNPVKKMKLETVVGTPNATASTQNGTPFKKKCPKCNIQFILPDPMKRHMKYCCYDLINSVFPTTSTPDQPSSPLHVKTTGKGKIIMLVSDFYYGRHEGDTVQVKEEKALTTFKCNSCLKVLKSNIRFMNHMKHHLELEKQSNESWESHTTCQHCYRQYATPFQLQCHIESAHSPYESTTNCKICELAFESEQALLEHMKFNHKPGEMPYVCQVCNYRSSFFSEVESHFRSVHENTKDLLCPFCLKVLRSGHTYMQHYMRHQKKGIHRCGKCRLNFLTYKERSDHRAHLHRTFKKPRTLEGLPPGTKVTIRASLSGGSSTCPKTPEKSIVSLDPSSPTPRRLGKSPVSTVKSKSLQAASAAKSRTFQNRRQERLSSSRQLERSNQALKSLQNEFGTQLCVECYTEVKDFYGHYPLVMKCSACKYQTSCKKSFENHMIRFHSAISRDRFRKMRKPTGKLRFRAAAHCRSLTLVCLNCDFLEDASGSDLMTKHLIDRPHHTCQVIIEKGTSTAEPKKTQSELDVKSCLDLSNSKDNEVASNGCQSEQSSTETNGAKDEVQDPVPVSSPKDASGSGDSDTPRILIQPDTGETPQPKDGKQSETQGAPAEPGPAEAPGVPAEPGPAETQGAPAEPGPAEAPGAPEEPDQAETQGAPAEPGPAEAPGVPAEPGPAETKGVLTEPGPAEAPGALAEPGPAETKGVPTEPGPAEAPGPPTEPGPAETKGVPTEPGPAKAPGAPTEPGPAKAPGAPTEPGPAETQDEGSDPKDASPPDAERGDCSPARDESKQARDGVPFEEFLRKEDQRETASPSGSKHGLVTLEPLTPSKVLEHEATEILQQGNGPPSKTQEAAAECPDGSGRVTPETEAGLGVTTEAGGK
uniref:Zinc finger protein 280D n=1 Tax=Paramormyrops kingsleyae TaxID=1676925 RepID=A0A3B3QJM0_9TELE